MKKWSVVFLVAVLAVCWVGSASAADAKKKLRVGTEGAYPPFNLVDKKGQVQGFDIDIAKALCKEMGMDCEFKVQDWDGLIPGLMAKKFDVIIASMSITDERKQKVDFSNKYYQTPARFVAKKGAGITVSKEGLKGKSVGVQRATIHENFVRDMFGDAVTVNAYATQDEANMDLVAGRVDLVIADATVLLGGFINTDAGKGFEFIGPSYVDKKWFGDGVGIALRKGDNELRQKLNKAIDAIRANGVYQKINAKYFDFDVYGK
ncbi:MAG: ABC transporter substrate-binding protein [Lentisphaerota bacterium]